MPGFDLDRRGVEIIKYLATPGGHPTVWHIADNRCGFSDEPVAAVAHVSRIPAGMCLNCAALMPGRLQAAAERAY